MAAAYSQDLRDKVLGAFDRGMKTVDIAHAFGVSESWARRVKQWRRDRNQTTALPMGGKRFQKIDRVKLAELVMLKPDATLKELREGLNVVCAISAIEAALKKLDLSYKKRRSMPRNKIGPMLRGGVRNGSSGARASIRGGWSSSTRPGPRPT